MNTYQIALYGDESLASDEEDPAEFVELDVRSRAAAVEAAKQLLEKHQMFLTARVVRFDEDGDPVDTDEVWRQGSFVLSKSLVARSALDLAS